MVDTRNPVGLRFRACNLAGLAYASGWWVGVSQALGRRSRFGLERLHFTRRQGVAISAVLGNNGVTCSAITSILSCLQHLLLPCLNLSAALCR